MSIDDIIAIQTDGDGEKCVVCGKSVAGGHFHARVKHGDKEVLLCCPLCLETFEKSPDNYLRRQQTDSEVKAILALLKPRPVPVP